MNYGIEQDPRFLRGIEFFNVRDYLDASEEFEELFFEVMSEELEFVRFFLQVSVGLHHIERGQNRASIERLKVAIDTLPLIKSDRGYDLQTLNVAIAKVIEAVMAHGNMGLPSITWPTIERS